jgi:hypothetical protein
MICRSRIADDESLNHWLARSARANGTGAGAVDTQLSDIVVSPGTFIFRTVS